MNTSNFFPITARASWLLDLTTELGIPVIAAISVAKTGDGLACGMAARLSTANAARAAIMEMCQMELAIQVTNMKRLERGDARLNDVDRRHLIRATTLNAETCVLLHPQGTPQTMPTHDTTSDADAIAFLGAALAVHNIDVALVDLSLPRRTRSSRSRSRAGCRDRCWRRSSKTRVHRAASSDTA